MPTFNSTLICNINDLTPDTSTIDRQRWGNIYNTLILNVMLVDRSKAIQMPYNFNVSPNSEIPSIPVGFNKTYENICNERAIEILEKQKQLNIPIYLLYSGGIDSTLVLLSLLKNKPLNELKDILVVAMSPESIGENPNFYKNYIYGKLRIVSSENFNGFFDGTKLVLGGEHNDQLFGSDVIAKINRVRPFSEALLPYSKDYIAGFFKYKGMSEESANWWYNMLVWHSKQAPCEIKSNFDMLWWLNFCFKWQSVFYRILVRVAPNQRSNISQNFIDNYFVHFFNTPDFQIWSMTNSSLKINSSWDSYKHIAKEIIHAYDGNTEYMLNKSKIGSLSRLFKYKTIPWGLTSDFEYIDKFKPEYKENLYNPNNSFFNTYG